LAFCSLVLAGGIPRGGTGSDNGGYLELTATGAGTFVIDTQNAWHGFLGLSADEKAGDISSHVGTRVNLAGATFISAGGGAQTQITGVAHGLSVDDYVTITGSSDAAQNGVAEVVAVGGATDFTVDIVFSSNPATKGFVTHPDHAEIQRAGIYLVIVTQSGTAITGASTGVYAIFKNKNMKHEIARKYANALNVGAHAVSGLVDASIGDEIWLGVKNSENTNDFTITDTSFVVARIW